VVVTGCGSAQSQRHGGADDCTEYGEPMAGKSPEEKRKVAEAHSVQMHGNVDWAHVERHCR